MTGIATRTAISTPKKIRVLIVDDSAMMRSLLSEIINSQKDMEAVGAAADPIAAREMIKSLNPDVLTLDIEMPKMDGLEFLGRLMALRPMPVVMVSTLTEKGSEITLRALQMGAIDFVSKPKLDLAKGLRNQSAELVAKIRVAAVARIQRMRDHTAAPAEITGALNNRTLSTEKLIVIGASTGGTEALREVLTGMPPDAPGILIVQHMPEGFTRSFANRLNEYCHISVQEACGGERILPGHAYIAPGHSHLLLARSGANYITELSQTAPVNRHRPSVDVLFRSAAKHAGPNAIGIILTGMGKDGAQGLLEMKRCGAHTMAQDEQSCVVFGMPKEAIALGATDVVRPLPDIAKTALTHLRSMAHTGLRV